MNNYEVIKKNVRAIVEENGLELDSLFLFGSRARKEHEELSDYDIFVVIKEDIESLMKRQLQKKIYHILHSTFPLLSFDIIVKTKREFDIEKRIVNTLSNEVVLEGIEI